MKTVAAALVALLCLSGPAAAQTKVIFGLSSEGFLAVPLHVARAKGFFEKEGLRPETVTLQGGPLTTKAAIAGDIDIMVAASVATIIQAQIAKQDVGVFATLVDQLATAVVVQGEIMQKAGITEATPVAERLKHLKGLRIGITGPGSSTDQLARYLSSTAGLAPDRDVTIVPVGNSAATLATFSRQRIDAFILSSPTPETAEQEYGGRILLNLAKGEYAPLHKFIYSCLAARADWLEKNSDTARRINRAMASALALIHSDPQEARRAAQPAFNNVKPAIYEAAFANNAPAYPPTPRVDPAGIETALAFAAATEGQRPALRVEDLYTNRFLPQ